MASKPDFDLLDRNFYAADPWPVYAWLREFDPVHWDEKNGLNLTDHSRLQLGSPRR